MAGDVAVITIRAMSESADSIVEKAIESELFRASRAVLIDVRGNNGGSRHVLRTLVPLLIDTPLVYNVAVTRGDMDGIGVDSDYGLTTPADSGMAAAVRVALRDALAAFKPSWDYRAEGFLPTVLGAVLLPAPRESRIKGKRVAVLIDEGCFSSCDIFAGAIRLAPDVTLIGTTTAGGSGRSRDFVLPNSRLRVTLSTMASFQPNGALYDGVGIRPAIVVERSVGDLDSGRDTQKEAALRLLRR
jgi:C-terminal processing protease CtpA/Prc